MMSLKETFIDPISGVPHHWHPVWKVWCVTVSHHRPFQSCCCELCVNCKHLAESLREETASLIYPGQTGRSTAYNTAALVSLRGIFSVADFFLALLSCTSIPHKVQELCKNRSVSAWEVLEGQKYQTQDTPSWCALFVASLYLGEDCTSSWTVPQKGLLKSIYFGIHWYI